MRHKTGPADVHLMMEDSAAPASRSWMTLPNLLTLSRIPMAALVWLRPRDPVFVLGLMALAGLTDVLDGWAERRRRRRSGEAVPAGESMGTWLDPLCDKLFIVSVLAAITVAHGLPLWIIPLIALREILQTLIVGATRLVPAVRRRLRPKFRANVLGKATTVAQFFAIAAILLGWPHQILFASVAAGLGAVAVVIYVRRARA